MEIYMPKKQTDFDTFSRLTIIILFLLFFND